MNTSSTHSYNLYQRLIAMDNEIANNLEFFLDELDKVHNISLLWKTFTGDFTFQRAWILLQGSSVTLQELFPQIYP